MRAAHLGRRVTTWAMGMARSPPRVGGWSAPGARAPRPASTDSGACAASTPIGSHRPHVGAVRPALAAHFEQLRMATATSHEGRHFNASPSSAAPVPGRGACLGAPRTTHRRMDGAALLPAARRSAVDHVTHGAADHPRAGAPLRRTGVRPCAAARRPFCDAATLRAAPADRVLSRLSALAGGVTRLRPPAAEPQPVLRSAALLWSGGAPERAACSRAFVLQSSRAPERPCSRLHGRVSVVMGAASQTATPLAAHRVVSAAATIRPQRT